MDHRALPPETLEGWYALHQIFVIDRAALRDTGDSGRSVLVDSTARALTQITTPTPGVDGWTAVVELIGSVGDVMLIHFRSSLDAIADAQRSVRASGLEDLLSQSYSFLSVTEAGMYHLTAQLAREAAHREGTVGDETYVAEMTRRLAEERESPHAKRRLYPPRPDAMPYVCFYPMSKRRSVGQNWYALTLDERSRLMQAHGLTGRKYAGRVQQVITGAIGLDAWEWGVTLFAKDPLDFKRLVTEMRFDEVSAQYAEFGEFYVGRLMEVMSGGDVKRPGFLAALSP